MATYGTVSHTLTELFREHERLHAMMAECRVDAGMPQCELALLLRAIAEFEGSLRRHFDSSYSAYQAYLGNRGTKPDRVTRKLAEQYYEHFIERDEHRIGFDALLRRYAIALGRRLGLDDSRLDFERVVRCRDWLAHGRVGPVVDAPAFALVREWIRQFCQCIPNFPSPADQSWETLS